MSEETGGYMPRGSLLFAMPQLMDPNFMHGIVLMIEHNESGAYGLLLNRPFGLDLDALLPDAAGLTGKGFPVHDGGPVNEDQLQFVHRIPEVIPGGVQLADDLYFGGEATAMIEAVGQGRATTDDLRLFVGNSGWSGGQLDEELKESTWMPSPPNTSVVFDPNLEEASWRRAFRSLGPDGEGLSRMPPDPSWN